mgnify:CR=1 FL=1
MKSVFSKASKSSLFSHVVRLAMTCMLCLITVTAFAGGTWDAKYRAYFKLHPESTGNGTVYVTGEGGTSTWVDGNDEKKQLDIDKQNSDHKVCYQYDDASEDNVQFTNICFHAYPKDIKKFLREIGEDHKRKIDFITSENGFP